MTKRTLRFPLAVLAVAVGLATTVALTEPAGAVATPVPLGTAESFAVLGGQTVTNTGPSIIAGDVGVDPGSDIVGFPPGIVTPPGTIHTADAVALQAQSDLTTAYDNAAGQAADADLTGQDLGGLAPVPGVYTFSSSSQLTGTLTLDAAGDPDALWVFQIGTTLTTASNSSVSLIGGAQPCNVFWQVGSSATLGTTTNFSGTIMALTSITANTNASIDGRLLARNGAVTLDDNLVTNTACTTTEDTTPPPETTPSTEATTTTEASTTTTAGETTTTAVTTTAPGGPPPSLARTGTRSAVPAVFTGLLAILLGGLALGGARRFHRGEI